MANTKPEMLLFAVDNSADVEQYLFLNHPTSFTPLTTDTTGDHHSAPSSQTTAQAVPIPIPGPKVNVNFASPHAPTSRKSSTTSTRSAEDTEGYLGGGALRHLEGSHHQRALAELAALDQQAKAKRTVRSPSQTTAVRKPLEAQQGGWLAASMAWWPQRLDAMEFEWSEEFYD